MRACPVLLLIPPLRLYLQTHIMVSFIFSFSVLFRHGYMVDFAASSAWQYPGPCKSYVKQVIKISSAYQSSTCLHVQTPAVFQQYGGLLLVVLTQKKDFDVL